MVSSIPDLSTVIKLIQSLQENPFGAAVMCFLAVTFVQAINAWKK